jgi:hypothetical protein
MPDSKAASAAMEEGRSCLSDLESWEVYWPGARRYRELLIDLTAIANDVIKAAASGADSLGMPGSMPSPIPFNIGGMSNLVPHPRVP